MISLDAAQLGSLGELGLITPEAHDRLRQAEDTRSKVADVFEVNVTDIDWSKLTLNNFERLPQPLQYRAFFELLRRLPIEQMKKHFEKLHKKKERSHPYTFDFYHFFDLIDHIDLEKLLNFFDHTNDGNLEFFALSLAYVACDSRTRDNVSTIFGLGNFIKNSSSRLVAVTQASSQLEPHIFSKLLEVTDKLLNLAAFEKAVNFLRQSPNGDLGAFMKEPIYRS